MWKRFNTIIAEVIFQSAGTITMNQSHVNTAKITISPSGFSLLTTADFPILIYGSFHRFLYAARITATKNPTSELQFYDMKQIFLLFLKDVYQ